MADLTGKTLANGYPNLVTIGATTDDNPTSGTLENGKGNNLTSVTFDGAVVVNESGGDNDFRVEGDTDQNLIVADASADKVGIGTNAPSTKLEVTDSGATVQVLNRTTSDGTILEFKKANTSVGTIGGAFGERLFIGNGDTGIRFAGDLNSIVPWNPSTNATNNGTVSLGESAVRFKDLYVSDGVYLGGTTSANLLDDYEEGTWSPVYTSSSGTFTTMTMNVASATYTKIGRQVTVRAIIGTDNVDATGASGDLRISGLPFANATNGESAISTALSIFWSTAPDSGYVRTAQSVISLMTTNGTAGVNVSALNTGANTNYNRLTLTATYFV